MTTPEQAARAVALESARAYAETFDGRLAAAYLLGSLSYGGYSAAVSDIDLALVLTDSREGDATAFQATSESLRERGALQRKVSVFWGSLPALRGGRDDGRFPAIDRLELAVHSELLFGEDVAAQVARPSTEEVLLEGAEFAVGVLATDEVVAEFHEPRRLLKDLVWFTKAVLFPVRFLYTNRETTGRAARNDEAIAWYLAQPEAPAAALVRLAEQVRAGHPLDPAEADPLLAAGLLPLYRYYIDDQVPRLREAGAPAELVTAFVRWRERLATRS
ncbi:hypothetical protein L3Q67_24020 [Saccharothrix sp. AJ9571]|nr:hypothetical protein L3Q67_24020 [Saccharothrix sp. AJ9571]